MNENKNIGLKIGAVFSIVSFLLTFTIAVPMFSVMPAIFSENWIREIFPGISYAQGCIINLWIFVILFLVVLFLIKKNIKKGVHQKKQTNALKITLTMSVFYFLVHPIGYYIFMWFSGFPIDALNAMMSIGSFPFTSLSFVIIGFFMDWYRVNKKQKYAPI